jgi:hypothetical protein
MKAHSKKCQTFSGPMVSDWEFQRRRAAEQAKVDAAKRSKTAVKEQTLAEQVFGARPS